MSGIVLMPESVIARRPLWTIALNRNQNLLGKSMLVLDRSCAAVTDVRGDEWTELHTIIRRWWSQSAACSTPTNFNFAFLMNQDAQVHLHVLPRYATSRRWNGELFTDSDWGSAFGGGEHLLETSAVAAIAKAIAARL
jgi:diadenosine tetraphosphate (Ap4A) HIT family hydrolase